MAHTIANRVGSIDASPASFVQRLMGRFADYRTYRRTVDELAALSDRELSDLGLSRQDIRSIAHESVYGA